MIPNMLDLMFLFKGYEPGEILPDFWKGEKHPQKANESSWESRHQIGRIREPKLSRFQAPIYKNAPTKLCLKFSLWFNILILKQKKWKSGRLPINYKF